jgi:hypothetical protein
METISKISGQTIRKRHFDRNAQGRFAMKTSLKSPAFLAAAAFLAGAVSWPGAAWAQSSLKTDDLIGRWGVAAYWNDADAARVTAQAKGFCSQPYVISKGKNGGAMMFEAFEGKPKEVIVQSNQIVSADGSGRNSTKAVQSWTGNTLVFNYVDEEPRRKYGNMVFVRCGR